MQVNDTTKGVAEANILGMKYKKNPDYIFIVDRAATTGGSAVAEQIFDNDQKDCI